MCIPINLPKLAPLQSKAEDSLFTLLNLNLNDANDKERLEKEKTAIWAKIELLMDLCPSAFCRKYEFEARNYEVYPLGVLFALKAPEDLIKTAYEVFPEAANDAFSLACGCDVDLELIKWLYNKAPEVVKWKDQMNNLPLHVVMGRDKPCLRTVQFIYQSYPAALRCKNEDGHTPLHLAFCHSSLAIVKFLIGKSKAGAVEMEDNDKDTPLHCAFIFNDHEEVLEFVATKYPEFFKKARSSDGRLPLHVACAISISIVGIQVLLEHYPAAAKEKDKEGKLPLALACKTKILEEEELLEVLELLVRAYPGAVDVEDNGGNKAIDIAMQGRLLKHMAEQPPAKKRRINYNIGGEEPDCLAW
jgi:ankyrin repeat protein